MGAIHQRDVLALHAGLAAQVEVQEGRRAVAREAVAQRPVRVGEIRVDTAVEQHVRARRLAGRDPEDQISRHRAVAGEGVVVDVVALGVDVELRVVVGLEQVGAVVHDHHAGGDVPADLVVADLEFLLQENVPRIDLVLALDRGGSRASLAVDQRPVERCSAPVIG